MLDKQDFVTIGEIVRSEVGKAVDASEERMKVYVKETVHTALQEEVPGIVRETIQETVPPMVREIVLDAISTLIMPQFDRLDARIDALEYRFGRLRITC